MTIESKLGKLTGDLPHGVSEGVALGTGLADGFDLYESALGNVVVTFNPRGVSSVDLASEGFAERFADRFERRLFRAEAPSQWRRFIPEALEAGRPGTVPVDLRSVTAFQADVLHETARIPKGEVRPYSWLARRIERPRAVRATGSALARNPIPLIIPCHRVVRSDGQIGRYSLGDAHNKVVLLEREGVDLEALKHSPNRSP